MRNTMISLYSLIHKKIVVLRHSATLKEAARAMNDNRIGCTLISGPDGEAAGIITDRDLACHWGTEAPRADRTVDEVMSRNLVAADENVGLKDILHLMETHGVRRIPLVARTSSTSHKQATHTAIEKTRFIGIVTLDDLVAAELVETPQLSRIVRSQISRNLINFERPYTSPRIAGHLEARSEAHKAQTLQRFHAHLMSATGLSQDLLPQLSHFILGSLTMRVSVTGAMHFIAQLPELIQAPLLELPPGPDKFISSRTIIEEMVNRFHLKESYARIVLRRFISALTTWMSAGQLEHLQSQLPQDFDPYFELIPQSVEPPSLGTQPNSPAFISVTSPVFSEGGEIPKTFTSDGFNRSPQIEWSHIPSGTKEFALICEDADSSHTNKVSWISWVIYGISNSVTQLPEGLPEQPEIHAPILARQGKNSTGAVGYQGPLPPEKDNWHRYYFRIYALDHEISLPPGATAEELRQEMQGHILGEGALMGRYRRARKLAA